MYEIMNQGKRSFIVGKEDVLKGGIRRTYPAERTIREEIEIAPGNTIYHVTDACGKLLKGYKEIFVLRINGKEVPAEVNKEITVEEQIARLTAQIEDLKTAKKVKKAKPVKKAKETAQA